MGAFSEKYEKVDFSDPKTIPSDDLNDEDDHEVEDTDTDVSTEIGTPIDPAIQREIDLGRF
ncbi:hypothetical protein [Nocardia alba]|uniref:Uncharacterized protein n=1 Tax=Nocardia alba TaxID=225051 RepID=A0A4V2PB17_9NOCA|nr:hypothetical protein [Nocardia alba]TCJ95715.1 hypothetical protein DFR71_4631 [Nocardia alba]